MSAVETTVGSCPLWCNRPHQPGANPRRQSHENTLKLPELGVTLHAGSTWEGNFTDEGVVSVELDGLIHGRWAYLSASSAAALAERLADLATAAEAAQAARLVGDAA